jgi:hypothetical protein
VNETRRTSPRELRTLLGRDGVLTPSQAVDLLPWGRDIARAYLSSAGLIRSAEIAGEVREWVVWGEVLDDLRTRSGGGRVIDSPPRTRGRRPRVRLPMSED